jgi:hypothetical protein
VKVQPAKGAGISTHLALIRDGKAFLLFNPEAMGGAKNEAEHFRTLHPIYFNGE